ncbi:NUDIX hydrolase [Pacificispira sp.]|uniref:NUDIX hydrolase n=1 Tax=Pacificispira sp. TaxID=2888761 RepID=UPI003BAA80F8
MLLQAKSVQQVASLPYIFVGGEPQVLLITSRERKRWIIPKGWPVKGRPAGAAAALEAAEEAGVFGIIAPEPIGYFDYLKRMPTGYDVPASAVVYPLLVLEQRLEWAERKQRKQRWYTLDEAARRVEDKQLASLIGGLRRDGYSALRALAEGMVDGAS